MGGGLRTLGAASEARRRGGRAGERGPVEERKGEEVGEGGARNRLSSLTVSHERVDDTRVPLPAKSQTPDSGVRDTD